MQSALVYVLSRSRRSQLPGSCTHLGKKFRQDLKKQISIEFLARAENLVLTRCASASGKLSALANGMPGGF